MKIITYNIQNYEGDWNERLHLIADLINNAQPDIICLNEVRGLYDGTPNEAEQIQGLLENGLWNLQVTQAAVYAGDNPPDWEGLAILSRQDLLMVETGSLALKICSDTLNRRIVQFASFNLDGSGDLFYVFNNHLTTDSSSCYGDQLNEVIAFANKFTGSAVLVGDLNQPHEENLCGNVPCVPTELNPLLNAGWVDLWMHAYKGVSTEKGYTWQIGTGLSPTKRLDYIWARGDAVSQFLSIEDLGGDPVNGTYLSDHMAVMATLNIDINSSANKRQRKN